MWYLKPKGEHEEVLTYELSKSHGGCSQALKVVA